jgi:hypothetical protein
VKTVPKIAQALDETEPDALATISRAIKVIGEEKALALLEETLKIEAEGGMLVDDGSRRRSPGGVFFKLVKNQTTSRERGRIFGPSWWGTSKSKPKAKAKPKPITWAESQALSQEALQARKGEATTVKVTIVGQPGRVIEKGAIVITAMDSQKLPALPKALPRPPDDPTTYLVYIAAKQWRKVKDSFDKNPDDKLIIEGYPVFDQRIGESGALTVYAQSVTTMLIQQAKREKQKASSE